MVEIKRYDDDFSEKRIDSEKEDLRCLTDTFSDAPDANAYRRYLKMLYDRAENKANQPKYLLLFGDCAWDNRMKTADWRTASVDDYLLCFESEDSFNEITCYVDDGFFTLLDDGEGVNLAVDAVAPF